MRHAHASPLLTDLVAGSLDPDRRRDVEQHLAGCEQCRLWMATYRLFQESLATGREASSEHLAEEELVMFALEPEQLDEVTRRRCERHLESCPTCLGESELTREAVFESRRRRPFALAQQRSRRRLAAAAGLLLLVGSLGFALLAHSPQERQVVDVQLLGNRTFDARRSILLGDTDVASGASVTLRSGEVVVLGNGLSIASDAQLTVRVDGATKELSQESKPIGNSVRKGA